MTYVENCPHCGTMMQTIDPAYRPRDRFGALLDVSDRVALIEIAGEGRNTTINTPIYRVTEIHASLQAGDGTMVLARYLPGRDEVDERIISYSFHLFLPAVLKVTS